MRCVSICPERTWTTAKENTGEPQLETERMRGVIQEPLSGEKERVVENRRCPGREIEAADQCDDGATSIRCGNRAKILTFIGQKKGTPKGTFLRN